MTTAEEAFAEFDREMARRMVAPYREIAVQGLQPYWQHHSSTFETEFPDGEIDLATLERDPIKTLLEESEDLYSGQAILKLPDGSRWAHVRALVGDLHPSGGPTGENTFLHYMWVCLFEHKLLRDQDGEADHGHGLPEVVLDVATLDLTRVFCIGCRQVVDLVAEDKRADELEASGEIAPWEND